MKTLIAALAMVLAQDQDKINELIQQLGSDEYAVREKATEELRKIGKPAEEALKKASEHQDPEVRTRAKGILEEMNKPAEKPRQESARRPQGGLPGLPGRPGFGFRGSSLSVRNVNGDAVYTVTPSDGHDPITFHKAAGGRVKLEYPDGKGGTAAAESETLEKFMADHKELATKYGISEEGINYGGVNASFKGGLVVAPGMRGLELPRAFRFENFGNLLEETERLHAAGATFEKVSEALRSHFEIPEGQGLVVVRAPEGSAAYAAGLRKSDVLLEIDGRKVAEAQDVVDGLKKAKSLSVLRKGKRETVAPAAPPRKDF